MHMENSDLLTKNKETTVKTKVYKRRWIILVFYITYAAINAFQWFEYSIISDVIMRFYNVSSLQVDWTSIIYMALYMPMVIPASYFIERKGLRTTAILGVLGTTLGTTIKVFSIESNRIWMVYLAQTILSSMQVFILALPPMIAAVWFGAKEASLACALGVFGTQLGQALGFIVPPLLVKNHDNLELIANDLQLLVRILAGISIISAAVVLIYFPKAPPLPPSHTQVIKKSSYKQSLLKLFRDKYFIFHTFAYGINIGAFVSISTLLNQIVLTYFPGCAEDAGNIGLIMVILGMIGSVVFGYILDKTHRYKETTFGIYLMSSIAVVAFMYALESKIKVLVYLSGAAIGLFTNSYMPVGLELAIELTFPEPESTSSGILISMTQTMGVLFTLQLGWLIMKFNCFWALASMAFLLGVGALLTGIIPNIRKRQDFKLGNGNF